MDRMSTPVLWLFAFVGIVLIGALAGGMVLMAGATLRFALLLAGFVICIELFYYGLAAVFSMMRLTLTRRRRFPQMTEQENLAARIERARQRLKQRGELIKQGICPYCHQPMAKIQHHNHIMASPCGHVLYRGKLS